MIDLPTYSRMQSRRTCPKKHWIEYELGIRREASEAPLRIGSAIHEALDVHAAMGDTNKACAEIYNAYSNVPAWSSEYDWRVEEQTCLALFMGYVWRWSNSGYEVIATEQEFKIPICDPKTGRQLWYWGEDSEGNRVRVNAFFAGKIDKIVRLPDGRIANAEHKTTGSSIDDDSDYWKLLRVDTQITGYLYAARHEGYESDAVIYDVIRKPSISPTSIPLRDDFGLKIVTDKDGNRLFKKDGTPYQSVPKGRDASVSTRQETPQEFGDRLRKDIGDRPDFYFQRREIPRLEQDIDQFKRELVATFYEMKAAREIGCHQRNTKACRVPFPCTYREPCWNGFDFEHGTPEGFVRVEDIHPELKGSTNA